MDDLDVRLKIEKKCISGAKLINKLLVSWGLSEH